MKSQEFIVENADQAAVDALLKKYGWAIGRIDGDLGFTWQGNSYRFQGERMRITYPNGQSMTVIWGKRPDWQGRPGESSFAQAVQNKYLTFDLPIWQALDRGQITDAQALQRFKAENERQAREAIAQGVSEGFRVANQQIPGTKNRAQSAYYPTNVKPKVKKLDKPLTDKELTKLSNRDIAKDMSTHFTEGPVVQRIVHPNKISIYVRMGNRAPQMIATDVPYQIFDKYVTKVIEKYPQFKPTDFSFKASERTAKPVTEEGQESCPECGGPMFSELLINEKQDACYYKVKSRYKVWPSAYASGALVQCRKKGAKNWGNKSESAISEGINQVDENLKDWFKEKWVRFGPDGKIRGDCARGDDSEGKPKCLPQSKAHALGKKGRASAAARKRRQDPNAERSGPAINVNTKKKKKSNESQLDELKCWPGYTRVPGVPAGAPGSCKKKTNEQDSTKECPPATQDITLNLKNRQKAIDEYGYGPLNPDMPNNKFWMKKVDEWNLDSVEEAKQSLCGNCAAFDVRQHTLDCIAQGIDADNPTDAEGVIDAGDLGYCKFLKFKCASRRTCDAWVTGGPLTDKTELDEKWSQKYKSSINCNNPKGFSQRAHCAGRNKNESVDETANAAQQAAIAIAMKKAHKKPN